MGRAADDPGPEAIRHPLDRFVDPDAFTPRLLTLLSNALVWRESRELRRRFGLGTNEWRVLSALAMSPGWSATDVSVFLGMNKALISKSVKVLLEQGLVLRSADTRGARQLFLTAAGARMHDAMHPVSMRGEEIIHQPLTPAEVAQLRELLQRLLRQVPDLLDDVGDDEWGAVRPAE